MSAGELAADRRPGIAMLAWPDRFEDFHDKVGVSLETFRDEYTGTWVFNVVAALGTAGLRPVLYFVSARVDDVQRFHHRPTATPVRVLPAPLVHRKLQGARDRLRLRWPAYRALLSYAATPWMSLSREIRADGCGAILCHEYEYPRFDEAVLAGRLLGLPVFATYQGGSVPESRIEVPFRWMAVRRAAGLVTGSASEARRLREHYGVPPDHVALLPNPVDTTEWTPLDRLACRRALGLPADAVIVVWHGRVEVESKGLDVLVDAWRSVVAARPGLPLLLVLVGSAQDDEDLRRRLATLPPAAARWEDQFVLDPSRVRQYLGAADMSVLPSRREGFSIALVEAMASGLPVVATDVSGVREAFGDSEPGLIVTPGDVAALAAALGRLIDGEAERVEMGARARRRAETQFSLPAVGSRLRAFMERRGAFPAGR